MLYIEFNECSVLINNLAFPKLQSKEVKLIK